MSKDYCMEIKNAWEASDTYDADADRNDDAILGLISTAIMYERSAIRHLIERHRNGELPAAELIRLISARVKL